MTKSTGALVLFCLFTAASALYFWNDSSRRKIRETQLQQKISQLEHDLDSLRTQARNVQDDSEFKTLKTELMRLRAEVTLRRNVSTQLETVQLENARLIEVAQELQTELAEVRAEAAAQSQPLADDNAASTTTDQSPTNTAMFFYLRNPELAKRYFPDLYKSTFETNQP